MPKYHVQLIALLNGVKGCYYWFRVKIGLLAQNSASEILDSAVMVWKESFFSSRGSTSPASGLWEERGEGKHEHLHGGEAAGLCWSNLILVCVFSVVTVWLPSFRKRKQSTHAQQNLIGAGTQGRFNGLCLVAD